MAMISSLAVSWTPRAAPGTTPREAAGESVGPEATISSCLLRSVIAGGCDSQGGKGGRRGCSLQRVPVHQPADGPLGLVGEAHPDESTGRDLRPAVLGVGGIDDGGQALGQDQRVALHDPGGANQYTGPTERRGADGAD